MNQAVTRFSEEEFYDYNIFVSSASGYKPKDFGGIEVLYTDPNSFYNFVFDLNCPKENFKKRLLIWNL